MYWQKENKEAHLHNNNMPQGKQGRIRKNREPSKTKQRNLNLENHMKYRFLAK